VFNSDQLQEEEWAVVSATAAAARVYGEIMEGGGGSGRPTYALAPTSIINQKLKKHFFFGIHLVIHSSICAIYIDIGFRATLQSNPKTGLVSKNTRS
jgi:hypothetical protein